MTELIISELIILIYINNKIGNHHGMIQQTKIMMMITIK